MILAQRLAGVEPGHIRLAGTAVGVVFWRWAGSPGTDSGAAHPRGVPAHAGEPRPEANVEDRVNCSDVLSQLSDYLDAEAAQELCAQLEAHLSECSTCRIQIDTVKKTISLYRSVDPLECPEQVRMRLHAVLSFEYRKK